MDPTREQSSEPTGDVGTPQKRQNADNVATGSSILNPPAINPPINKMNDSSKSLHCAANKARLIEIRKMMNNLDDEEQKILEDCEKESTDEIVKLKLHISELEKSAQEAKKSSQEAKSALVAAEAQFCQLKGEKDQRIAELQCENAELEERMIQQAEQDTEKLNAAKKRMIELRQNMKSEASYREQLVFKETELEEAKRKITELESEGKSLWEEVQDLLSKASRHKKLEEEIQSVENSSATPQEAVEQEIPLCRIISGDKDMLKSAENVGSEDCEKLSSALVENRLVDSEEDHPHQQKTEFNHLEESMVNHPKQEKLGSRGKCEDLRTREKELKRANVEPDLKSSKRDSSTPVIDKNPEKMSKLDRPSCAKSGSDDGNAQQEQRIRIDSVYILASDGIFIDIDSKTNYQRLSSTQFKCSKCGQVKGSRILIEDHIWCKHYEGRYKCPLCLDPPVTFTLRQGLKRHMRQIHLQEVNSKDFDRATKFLQVLTTAR